MRYKKYVISDQVDVCGVGVIAIYLVKLKFHVFLNTTSSI